MIDFKDCPKDESWLLFDSDGNCEFMADEIKLAYACYQIAKEKLVTKMAEIRKIYDNVENILPDYIKPFPTYNNILF